VVGNEVRLNDLGKIVQEEWLKTPSIRPNIELDDYFIMPNHVHGILIIGERVGATRSLPTRQVGVARNENEHRENPARATLQVAPTKTLVSGSLGAIICQCKSKIARRINAVRSTSGAPVWQRNYYDHIIRNEADLHRIRRYIADNPMQWALDEENPEKTI
jgi:REP element-mobilizing transposase RayT